MSHHTGGHEEQQGGGRLDINRADKEELMRLDGMGEQMADRIVRHRDESGGFRSLEDLDRVEGFGEGTLENLKKQVSLGGRESGEQRGEQNR